MKEAEKLDFILKALYESPIKENVDIIYILAAKGIQFDKDELERLVKRLTEAGFVESYVARQIISVSMRSEGMEFVEGSSFAKKENLL